MTPPSPCTHTRTQTHTQSLLLVSCPSYPSGTEVLSFSNLPRLSGADGWQTDMVEGGTEAPGHKQCFLQQPADALSQPLHTAGGWW